VEQAGTLTRAEIDDARKVATEAVRNAIRAANTAPPAPADRDTLLGAVYAEVSS
jgi:hypothetical protein